MEGRDIGTVVAPDAAAKIFLTARPEVRAQRRAAELSADPAVDANVTLTELRNRDTIDTQRAASPLLKAADAVEIDASERSLDEVVAAAVDVVLARTAR